MAETKESKQIRQMINFIMQEAHEKCNEIRLKADHDYQLEIQNLVHAGKLRVQEEYAQKSKDLEVQERVARSNAVASSRIKKMKAREEMLENLQRETLAKLGAMTKTPAYKPLVQNLMVEGLVKLEETDVQIMCREEDLTIVKGVLEAATKEAKAKLAALPNAANQLKNVTIYENRLSSKGCTGGVVLIAAGGKIEIDQTLDERLNIAYATAMPAIRAKLFPNRT